MNPVLAQIKQANPNWFSRSNKRFFGDINYRLLYGKKSGERFLVRLTNAWSDMFDGVKKPHYRINTINDDLTIGKLLDQQFADMDSVRAWLKEN